MHPLPTSTPVDTSGDDTSSRGTLDSFIPPPKDFEGNNNPFRSFSELFGIPFDHETSTSTPVPTPVLQTQSPITLPLPLTPVISEPPIIRPAKRQLSEKDIIIDRNGQVKRKRQNRRGRPPQQQFQQTASKTATITPARNSEVKTEFARNLRSSFSSSTSSSIGNYVNYNTINGQRLKSQQNSEKLLPPEALPQKNSSLTSPSPKCSPVKQNTTMMSLNDLKSSVNIYFGTANRIASGENFVVKAKRYDSDGQLQYLIEWGGIPT